MKLVANLVLCALAFVAVADASSFRRMEACDGGDPEPTPPPVTTVPDTTVPVTTVPETTAPATTVPATTVPATTVPETTAPATTAPATTSPATTVPDTTSPATTVPDTTSPATTVPDTTSPATTVPDTTSPATTVPDTTSPATTVPATTVPATTAPATTAPATTAPATTAPAPAWDLTTPYDGPNNCNGFLRKEAEAADTLLTTDCVKFFSFYDYTEAVEACVVCKGTYDDSLASAPFPLCNNQPVCGRIGDFTGLTQGEVDCVIKADGSKTALDDCKIGSNAVTPAPSTSAPVPTTPAPETSAPAPTTPTPTYPVTSAPVPTSPTTWDMTTAYDSYGINCFGTARVGQAPLSTTNCVTEVFDFYNYDTAVKACLVCTGVYDTSVSPPLCSGKPICGRVGEYAWMTQTELQCIVNSKGATDVATTCGITDNLV